MSSWFAVDREGLSQILERRGKAFAVLELISNAWDEASTEVWVSLVPAEGKRGYAYLIVEDDAPEGFKDLTHAYTLFAPSGKKENPEKRGRFNLGEKLFLALCRDAQIETTTGTVEFRADGTRHRVRHKTRQGSIIRATIRMNRDELKGVLAVIHTLIPPADVHTYVNSGDGNIHALEPREPVRTFTATLPTEIADDEGYLRPTERRTEIRIYEPRAGETPSLYELGIPVVETSDRWHVDVQQKIPLNSDRDNVRPSYLRKVRTLVLNQMHGLIEVEDANAVWTRSALGDPNVTDEAVESVVKARFGDKAVIYDPSDPEANNLAVAKGFTLVHGRNLGKDEWQNVRRAGVLQPAGQVTPSNSHLQRSLDGVPPLEELTPAQERIVEYCEALARDLLGFKISVEIYKMPFSEPWAAAYGGRHLSLNYTRIGMSRFEHPEQHWWDALLLHEFAHELESNHLDDAYHKAICTLGARLRDATARLDHGLVLDP